ncbi:hypothetical protein ACVWW5_007369 [Bradyrhizobium sp. LM3.4]
MAGGVCLGKIEQAKNQLVKRQTGPRDHDDRSAQINLCTAVQERIGNGCAECAISEFGKVATRSRMNEPDTEFALESERSLMPQKKQHIDLSDPNLSSLILRLAIPSVVGLSIHALQQVVNAIFVGALGAQATAAVSMTLPIIVLLAAAGQGTGVGNGVLHISSSGRP